MAHSILPLWLLVAGPVPHAWDQEIPSMLMTQRISPTPVIQGANFPIFNNQKFALSLYKQLPVTEERKSILCSPLSITVLLTPLAFQDTLEARQLVLQNLGFKVTKDLDAAAATLYGKHLGALLHAEQCEIHTGSLLFMDKRLKPETSFLELAQSFYNTDAILISLGNYESAHEQINSAIRDRTQGKVKKLLRDLKPLPNLFLANYNFFKGKWQYRFNPKLTEMKHFSIHEGIRVMVPMMQRVGWFRLQYFPHLQGYVLQLSFTCNVSGVFILPNEGKIEECEKAFLEENFDTWIQPLPLSRRRLFFPKFSISVGHHLDNLKYATSGSNLFSEQMDLSEITLPKTPMKAIHKVELTVDEDAAEEEDISGFHSLPKPLLPPLHFNRPFLLLILEKAGHNLLFMGKVMNPGK